jgi:hypothetical protein
MIRMKERKERITGDSTVHLKDCLVTLDVLFSGDDFPGSPDVCTCALDVHRMCTFEVHTKKSEDDGYFTDSNKINKNYLLNDLYVHRNDGAQERSVSPSLSHHSCSFEKSAHIDQKAHKIYSNEIYKPESGPLVCTGKVHGSAHSAHIPDELYKVS